MAAGNISGNISTAIKDTIHNSIVNPTMQSIDSFYSRRIEKPLFTGIYSIPILGYFVANYQVQSLFDKRDSSFNQSELQSLKAKLNMVKNCENNAFGPRLILGWLFLFLLTGPIIATIIMAIDIFLNIALDQKIDAIYKDWPRELQQPKQKLIR